METRGVNLQLVNVHPVLADGPEDADAIEVIPRVHDVVDDALEVQRVVGVVELDVVIGVGQLETTGDVVLILAGGTVPVNARVYNVSP